MSHTHTDQDVIDVPDDDYVFLAVSAGNYETADRAFWTIKNVYGDRELTGPETKHLDVLRQRRRDAYADLVTWVNMSEAQRVHRQAAALGAGANAGGGIASALREEIEKRARAQAGVEIQRAVKAAVAQGLITGSVELRGLS